MARRVIVWVLVLLMVAFLIPGCAKKPQAEVTTGTLPEEDLTNARKTVLYFRDASGYIVPVMKQIPVEEGIAKAALKCLVAGTDEDVKLAAIGVTAPVPGGTTIDLDIAKGVATLNLKMTQKCADKAAEEAMIGSVVNTLLEFATVDKVMLQINGQVVTKLPNGAAVKDVYSEAMLNIEPVGAPDSTEGKLELCFANEAGRLLVPVYRVAGDSVSLASTLAAMMQPAEGSGLVSVFPPASEVLGVTVSDAGVATIEMSKDFASISDTPAIETLALRAIGVVCRQFQGVKEFKIVAGGKDYEPTVSTISTKTAQAGDFLNFYD